MSILFKDYGQGVWDVPYKRTQLLIRTLDQTY